ncbi:molybdate ABC transporter permease subunit [Oceanicella sp. SM1341]|uniref:molybdate ABC transporter permease subunit n=1 Tax=Oceanicella sp. SM1341 TaxID=1548889 RepID=UPI000E50AC34|nr:molybdate ABC transporter permease subunit [Oceanicella sp. SM1341]
MELPDAGPLWLSLRLAAVTTLILLVLGTALAWWLAGTRSRLKPLVEAVTALPLVLPPTVLGFYLLVMMSPNGPLGRLWLDATGSTLTFSFAGIVIGSVFYSLPFAVQPLQATFETIGRGPMEAAAMLRASPFDAFLSVMSPMALRGYLTAAVLTFAHTIGEFGVVLMVGGSIPGRTKVISIAIYEHVETIDYAAAHLLSAGLLVFSFLVLVFVYGVNRRFPGHRG